MIWLIWEWRVQQFQDPAPQWDLKLRSSQIMTKASRLQCVHSRMGQQVTWRHSQQPEPQDRTMASKTDAHPADYIVYHMKDPTIDWPIY